MKFEFYFHHIIYSMRRLADGGKKVFKKCCEVRGTCTISSQRWGILKSLSRTMSYLLFQKAAEETDPWNIFSQTTQLHKECDAAVG
jgi:hypothetical protein